MQINNITLKNFFSYKGIVSFDLSSTSSMSIIIGENGFGKTSFINSLKIALHGITKELLTIGETKLSVFEFVQGSKEKHFSGILNRVAAAKNIKECSVSIDFNHNKIDYRLIRTYMLTNSAYSESLTVHELDELAPTKKDEEAQDFINSIISPTLAKFFFFDGEKVQNIANFSNDEFRIMLEDVLELNVYDQIIKDYTTLKRDYIKDGIKDQTLKNQFDKVSCNIDLQKENITSQLSNIKTAKHVIKDTKKELTVIKNKIKKLNSQYSIDLENGKNILMSTQMEKEKKLELFKKISMSCLPLLLNRELGLKTEFDILNNYYDSNYIPIEVLKKKKKEFIEIINEKMKNGEEIEEIFDSVFFAENKGIRVSFVDTSKAEFQYKSLDLNKIAFEALLDNLILLDEKIVTQSAIVAEINISIRENELVLSSLINNQAEKTTSLSMKENEIITSEETIKNSDLEIENLEKELHSISIAEHKENLQEASILTCEKIVITAKKMKEVIKIQKRASLEAKINEKFRLLIKDNYDAATLKIDENFTINVFDVNDNAMDILSSSSGQKQIIATSLIWAISEYIDSDMPMIVDTPLGRLDSRNQELLLKNFYPNAANQIIILPTPSELKANGFSELIDSSDLYVLSNNGSIATVEKITNTKKVA